MRTKAKLLVGGVCIPILFAVLAVTTLGGAAEFVTPTDVEKSAEYDGQRVSLEGVVTNLSDGSERIEFDVADENASVPVVYDGQMPETMAEGRTVVAKGQYDGSVVRAEDLSVRAHEGERPESSKHTNATSGNESVAHHNGTDGGYEGEYSPTPNGTQGTVVGTTSGT